MVVDAVMSWAEAEAGVGLDAVMSRAELGAVMRQAGGEAETEAAVGLDAVMSWAGAEAAVGLDTVMSWAEAGRSVIGCCNELGSGRGRQQCDWML